MKIVFPPEQLHVNKNYSPLFQTEEFKKIRRELATKKYPRDELAKILLQYNNLIGNDEASFRQIDKLSQPDGCCIITGQQLGLMGGPAYTILKGISCLLAAKETGAIPIFWLATEDHDIAEIDNTFLIDSLGNLQRFHVDLPKDGRPVENVELNSKSIHEIGRFANEVGKKELLGLICDSYSRSMAKVMAHLFSGTGMVFIEPYLIRPLAQGFWRQEIENNAYIQTLLRSTAEQLKAVGKTPILNFEAGSNLFLKNDEQVRQRVYYKDNLFKTKDDEYTTQQVLQLLESHPEKFSSSAAARPVLQSAIFPTIAYVAGPSEEAYYQQLETYHQFHKVTMPFVIPRTSATFISPYACELLKRAELKPWENIPLHNQFIAPSELHFLRNFLAPHQKLQERTLNWFEFQKDSGVNLLKECLQNILWGRNEHQYIYFS